MAMQPTSHSRDNVAAREAMDEANKLIHKSSVEHASPPEELGLHTALSDINIDVEGKKKEITLGKVGNSILRGLAGVVGGSLYAATFLVGAGLNLAVALPFMLIAIPPAIYGAGIGIGIGSLMEDQKTGAMLGAAAGASLPLSVGAFALGVLMLPNALIFNTTGRLGAGLCAFAMTGKTEENQLKGEKFKAKQEFSLETLSFSDSERKKSTNEKLLDALYLANLPELATKDEETFKKTKKV